MTKRIHVPRLAIGRIPLDQPQAHHIQRVLRLDDGDAVEVFDDAGHQAAARLLIDAAGICVQIDHLPAPAALPTLQLTVASAIPKGTRADWLIEKLSEIGVTRFIPLKTTRSIVHPEGDGKLDRWRRLAIESAKQSHRSGTMQIDPLTPLPYLSAVAPIRQSPGWYLSTEPDAIPITHAAADNQACQELLLFIGPEGGWTPEECQLFQSRGFIPVGLTNTILRIETAALLAAGIVLTSAAGALTGGICVTRR